MSWTDPNMALIAEMVSKRTGLSFANCQPRAELGFRRVMIRTRAQSSAQYVERLGADEKMLDEVIEELTVGETYFFREPGHFRFIQREILPELARRRGADHLLRVWSASCASGEEAYSLAILFDQLGLSERTHLIATDISRSALAKAQQAVFSSWSLRGESPSPALPYLTAIGKDYRLDEKIQKQVNLAHLNLALDAYPSFATGIWSMDLILCRNVLIYLDRQTVAQVARRLFQTLVEGGWLITASSDPPLWDDAPFEVITRDEGIFYRRPIRGGLQAEPFEAEPFVIAEQGGLSALLDEEGEKGRRGDEKQSPGGAPLQSDLPISPSPLLPFSTPTRLDEAREALTGGDWARVVRLTPDFMEDAQAAVLHMRALANLDTAAAMDACARAVDAHPLCAELHYLHAVLLMDARQAEEAVQEMRRVLYLDRSLAVAHFTLGSILRQRGDDAGARRAYRNARDLCAGRPPDEAVPFADGESAGRLLEVAKVELALLEGTGS